MTSGHRLAGPYDILREKTFSMNFAEYVDENAEILEMKGFQVVNDDINFET